MSIHFYNPEGYSVTVIADSLALSGKRITTMQLRYPRIIHQEMMTHRLFSRNASSSRAIPVNRMHAAILEGPARPHEWRMNEPGMQGWTKAEPKVEGEANKIWNEACAAAIEFANRLNQLGIHKQAVNRLTEPFQFINVLITSTSWKNFTTLRYHEDADPTVYEVARLIRAARIHSVPACLALADWHLPYVTEEENHLSDDEKLKVSVARCARVSYLTHDGRKTSIEEDLKLYDRLLGAQPLHASPAEHQARQDWARGTVDGRTVWSSPELHGNLEGWIQYRKTLDGEFIPEK